MKRIMKNNSGFSMIELIAVVSIMALITSVAGFSLAMKPASEAKKTVLNIDAMMTRTRSGTLAKAGAVYMEVAILGDSSVELRYYEENKSGVPTIVEKEILSTSDNVEVYYTVQSGQPDDLSSANATKLTHTHPLVLSFNRSTTGFQSMQKTAEISHVSNTLYGASATTTSHCYKIWITTGTVEYFIDLGPLTGTHYPSIG